jgi:hypothetical protein
MGGRKIVDVWTVRLFLTERSSTVWFFLHSNDRGGIVIANGGDICTDSIVFDRPSR